jgi:hypothetical protein
MDNLNIMNGLTSARKIIRGKQFDLASSSPLIWQMMERILKYIDAQQAETLAAIRN